MTPPGSVQQRLNDVFLESIAPRMDNELAALLIAKHKQNESLLPVFQEARRFCRILQAMGATDVASQ
jgi:hypothetical protein